MTLTRTFLFFILTQIIFASRQYLASYNDLDYYDESSEEQGNLSDGFENCSGALLTSTDCYKPHY
jgi:hypothetical protein